MTRLHGNLKEMAQIGQNQSPHHTDRVDTERIQLVHSYLSKACNVVHEVLILQDIRFSVGLASEANPDMAGHGSHGSFHCFGAMSLADWPSLSVASAAAPS